MGFNSAFKGLKSRNMRWKEHVASMGKKMVEYRVLARKP